MVTYRYYSFTKIKNTRNSIHGNSLQPAADERLNKKCEKEKRTHETSKAGQRTVNYKVLEYCTYSALFWNRALQEIKIECSPIRKITECTSSYAIIPSVLLL